MSNKHDISRDRWMLQGPLAKKGYDWWWHSFTAENAQTGEKKPFFVEFYTCNPALKHQSGQPKHEPVIVWNHPDRQKQGLRPSYMMVNVGFWGEKHAQLHRIFAWQDVTIHADAPYEVTAGDCYCSETHTKGSVEVNDEDLLFFPEWMCDSGTMTWDLQIRKKIAFHVGYGASSFFQKLNAFEMFWHAEGMKTEYEGEIVLNGVCYIVRPETCNGYADKNWGGDFTSPWVWLSSNDLTSKKTGQKLTNSVFDIGGGRPKIYGWALDRKLLGAFFYEGKNYEFNFSKFWTLSGTKFDCYETEDEIVWHVDQTTWNARLVTDIRCSKKEMLNINYESPDGCKRHNRLWNGGTGHGTLQLYKRSPLWVFGIKKETLIDEIAAEGVGCEYGEYDKE